MTARYPEKPYACLVCGAPCPYDRHRTRRVTCSDACLGTYRSQMARDRHYDDKRSGRPNVYTDHRWVVGRRAFRAERRASEQARFAAMSPEERAQAGRNPEAFDALARGRATMAAKSHEERVAIVRKAKRHQTKAGIREAARKAAANRDQQAINAAVSRAQRPDPTLCAKGLHPWVPDNLRRTSGGMTCRACLLATEKARRERLSAEAHRRPTEPDTRDGTR